MKRSLKIPVKVTTGNRETWVRRGVFYVNPNNRTTLQPGWHDIVHSVSHYCHRRMFPRHKPHDGRGTHAWIERTMIGHVVNLGWLEGKLKRAARAPSRHRPSRTASRRSLQASPGGSSDGRASGGEPRRHSPSSIASGGDWREWPPEARPCSATGAAFLPLTAAEKSDISLVKTSDEKC
jgi:hypothetical protein